MTREEAKTFLLQFNTDKRLNPSEHEAVRVAITALEQMPEVTSTMQTGQFDYVPSVTQKSESVTEFADRCRECGARYGKLLKQKSGKWDRLYSWLNDMRLCIAPDETVTDIDERHCRESQTDILDEIMEWMIKADKEQTE